MRITAFEIGPGKSSVLRKLINKIGENNLKIVCTDGNFSYDEELGMNADIKHIVSKSETCLVESFKTLFSTMTKKNQGLQQITTDVRTLNSPISA